MLRAAKLIDAVLVEQQNVHSVEQQLPSSTED